jgi:hypothetical protein
MRLLQWYNAIFHNHIVKDDSRIGKDVMHIEKSGRISQIVNNLVDCCINLNGPKIFSLMCTDNTGTTSTVQIGYLLLEIPVHR